MHTSADHRLNGQLLPQTTRSKAKSKPTKTKPRWNADRVLYWSATAAPWGLAILLLMVSMPHLAGGFQTVCHCGPLAGWLLAVAIDTAQVVAKLQTTLAKRYTTTPSVRWTSTGIIAGTILMSMALNVMAFLAGARTVTGTVLAWVAGVMLPLLVLALSYTGSAFALAKVRKEAKVKVKGGRPR
ncbi:MAG TPA: hypothetical protein VFG68_10935 [Fimbriiglobus sp.]|nr:hypothetical protein [Fimbriiglobus sp.]